MFLFSLNIYPILLRISESRFCTRNTINISLNFVNVESQFYCTSSFSFLDEFFHIKVQYLVAGAVVGPDGVPAHVLAAAVVGGALVLVREEDGSKAVLLDRIV